MLYLSLENIVIRQISVLHTVSRSTEKRSAFRKKASLRRNQDFLGETKAIFKYYIDLCNYI